jgi:hypothetical protein
LNTFKYVDDSSAVRHFVHARWVGGRLPLRPASASRTDDSHLYNVYPKLAVSGRNGLRKVLNSVR